MKRIWFLMAFIVASVGLCMAEPPEMRPAAPDVKQEVQTDSTNYMPGVVKPPQEDQTNLQEQEEYEEVEEEEEVEEYKPKDENKHQEEPVSNTTKEQPEEEFSEPNNPINTDASADNIKDKNFVPETNNSDNNVTKPKKVKRQKVKKEKKKKEKKIKDGRPDFSKYKDAATDPYVQSIYEEKTEEQRLKEEEAAKPKTYTQDDYEQMYRDTPVPEFSYIHGVDPDQYYDMKNTIWSPYPLLRLTAPIYFKTMTIEPGYYLLTPRKYKDDWYILFKEAGAVKYIIPAISRDYTPANYYRDNLPELEMKKSQRWQIKFLNAWGKYIQKSKRKPAIQTNVELTDLDNNFMLMDLYYGHHKYSCIFRIEKY